MATFEFGVQETYQLGRNPSATLDAYVYDSTGISDARTVVIANTANVWKGMLRTNIALDRMTNTNSVEDGDWHAVVTYGRADVPKELEAKFSASTKGGRVKINRALSTFDSIGIDAAHPAADTGGAIGVDTDGNVNGVEVPAPQPTFSFEMHIDFSLITDSYWYSLEQATGRVNSRPFFGRKAHEVRFDGADFDGTVKVDSNETQLGRLRWDFSVSRSALYVTGNAATGVTVQGLQRPISKRGWDYLDVMYGEFVDATAKTKVRRPVMAWARQVMDEYDFNRFGITR